MVIYIVLGVLVSLALAAICWLVFRQYKSRLSVLEVNVENGWCWLDWSKVRCSRSVGSILNLIDGESHEWHDGFKELYFQSIYYMSRSVMLGLCSKVFDELDESTALHMKRMTTVSGIYYDFKVPAKLWLLDNEAINILLRYYVLCERVSIDIDKWAECPFSEPSFEDNNDFKDVMKHRGTGMSYVSKMCIREPLNIVSLYDHVKKDAPVLYRDMGGDVDNLKRLMTVCYLITGISIPRDYVLIDKNVYTYITTNGRLANTNIKRRHLTRVK